ncbi:MAG: hypothetical protein WCO63_09700 [Bacteroidota bacterium]
MPEEFQQNIELKSPELQEIMTKPPAWLTRWGIGMILALLSISLLLSIYIRYPEVVITPIRLDNPKDLVAGKPVYSAMIIMEVKGPCKVMPGQSLIIKFEQFPFLENGVVRGVVKGREYVSENNSYHFIVSLPDGLKTNTGTQLECIGGMRGIAEINVKEMSLFQNLFGF